MTGESSGSSTPKASDRRFGSASSEPSDGHDRPDRIQRRLEDLAEFVREAEYLTGKGQEAYLSDSPEGSLLRNAGERILIKVATVAEKLPQEFKDERPDIDWQGINRMRNLVAHHYDRVSHDLMWAALTGRIPDLGSRLTN